MGNISKGSSNRLTNIQRDSFSVSPDLHEVIIGISLGDLHINKQCDNARLMFKQGIVNQDYIYHLFQLFSSYSNMEAPKHREYFDKRTNKVYTSISFNSYSLPSFNYYYELFYVNGVKIIPLNISELLTPRALAYWLMDDSCRHGTTLSICTESFSEQEVLLLISVLKEKFNIQCNPMKRGTNKFRIYVRTRSLNDFSNLVSPYFIPSMMYKLSKENTDNE